VLPRPIAGFKRWGPEEGKGREGEEWREGKRGRRKGYREEHREVGRAGKGEEGGWRKRCGCTNFFRHACTYE